MEIGNINYYLTRIIGLSFEDRGDFKNAAKPFPALLEYFFKGRLCTIASTDCVLLEPAVPDISLSILLQRINIAEKSFNKPCILVASTLDGVQRSQLIQHRVPFIIPQRQLYLPFLGAYLTENKLNSNKKVSRLSPAAQFTVLFHLLNKDIEGSGITFLAEKMGYPPKTISIVATELCNAGLCSISQRGRSKALLFVCSGRELWDKALPMMSSPIQKIGYVSDNDESLLSAILTYDDALSHYTDMGKSQQRCYAIEKRSEKGTIMYGSVCTTNYPDSVRLEFWNYDPHKLSSNGYIDPLSMVLCYQNNEDERIKGQISRLIDKIL
jgi:hypothetical protein